MPNWSFNHLKVTGKKKDVLAFGNDLIGTEKYAVYLDTIIKEKLAKSHLNAEDEDVLANMPEYLLLYQEAYDEALETIKNQTSELEVTFNKIVPMPVECYIDQQNVVLPKGIEWDFRSDQSWYGWSYKNWGTKWDCCNADVKSLQYDLTEIASLEDDNKDVTLELNFNTAWTPPIPFMKKASEKHPYVTLNCSYQEEAGSFFIEEEYKAGEAKTIFESNNCIEWLIYKHFTISEILEDLTFHADTSVLETWLDDSKESSQNSMFLNIVERLKTAFDIDAIKKEIVSFFEKFMDDNEASQVYRQSVEAFLNHLNHPETTNLVMSKMLR